MKKDQDGSGWQRLMARDAEDQARFFEQEGLTEPAAAALVDIDRTMQRIRRSLSRRDTLIMLVKAMDPELDAVHLDVIGTVVGGGGSPGREVTVGLVAENLRVDPSRASRLVAEMVEMGYLKRVASQTDSRRICLELTEKGETFAAEFHRRKWALLAAGMKSWTDEEMVSFAALLARFADWAKTAREQQERDAQAGEAEPAE